LAYRLAGDAIVYSQVTHKSIAVGRNEDKGFRWEPGHRGLVAIDPARLGRAFFSEKEVGLKGLDGKNRRECEVEEATRASTEGLHGA
jgi:hypothetical protein